MDKAIQAIYWAFSYSISYTGQKVTEILPQLSTLELSFMGEMELSNLELNCMSKMVKIKHLG